MVRRKALLMAAGCTALLLLAVLIWPLPEEKTDDQLAIETFNALDLSIEALEVLLDEELEASDTYAVDWISGMSPDDTKESWFGKLLKWYDSVGLKPVNIIYYDANYPKNYWMVKFPGCGQAQCVALLDDVEFEVSRDSEWRKYFAGYHKKEMISVVLEPKLIGSTIYHAEVDVDFDFAGRVTKADLFVLRDFSSELEKVGTTLNNGGPTERRQIYYHRRILADSKRAGSASH